MKAFFRNNKKKLLKLLAVIAIVMIAATIWYEVPVTEHITISGEGKIGSPVSNGAEMIVSRGLARERMPCPGFFNHPEVVIIDIG